MTVIEEKIPIVEFHHQEEQSLSKCGKFIHLNNYCCCRNHRNDNIPIRALLLCNTTNNNSSSDEMSDINHMPIQLREVITIDEYNTFCNKINEWIQQHDIAAAHQYKYDKTYLYVFALVCITLIIYAAILGNALFVILALISLTCIGNVQNFHHALHIYYKMKYIKLQNIMYSKIERECMMLSNDISTSSVVITLHLGYSSDVGRLELYRNPINQEQIHIMNFDHIVVTSTTLTTIWPPIDNHSAAITTTTDPEGTDVVVATDGNV